MVRSRASAALRCSMRSSMRATDHVERSPIVLSRRVAEFAQPHPSDALAADDADADADAEDDDDAEAESDDSDAADPADDDAGAADAADSDAAESDDSDDADAPAHSSAASTPKHKTAAANLFAFVFILYRFPIGHPPISMQE